ncbi:unnamed protein product, partial [Effrenium voratum]
MEEEHFDVSSSFGFSEPRSKICGVDSTDLAQARSSFGQALRRHLAELQKRLLAEHEALFSDDHRHSLEKLVESLKEENDRLRMQEDSHANISSPTASSYKEERLDRNTRRSTASRRSVAKLRSRRSSFKGINLNDPRWSTMPSELRIALFQMEEDCLPKPGFHDGKGFFFVP